MTLERAGRTLPPARAARRAAKKTCCNVGKNQRQAPSILGFSLQLGPARRKRKGFPSISAPEPLKSSKPLSWLGLRCAIIASAAKGAAARPTGSHCPALIVRRGSGAAAARRRGPRTYNRRVRAVRVNL